MLGEDEPAGVAALDLLVAAAERWRTLLGVPVLAALLALGATYLVTPIYTARTSILPPASQQSAQAGALAALGGLGALAGGAIAAVRSPTDQLVALLQSETVADRMIERFDLLALYGKELRLDARRVLRQRTKVLANKKDGLIVVEVDDAEPKRAAAMANQYIAELRSLTSTLAVTEAQQRRAFFQSHLERTRDALTSAQRSLQASGFNAGALRAEPKAAAEEYARVKAEATAAEVRLQTLSARLTAATPEVQQAQTTLSALRAKLAELERAGKTADGPDYVARFREFKYQETLFEMFARQYELARVDESREGALIQVVDPALVPEWKSGPKRLAVAVATAVVAVVLTLLAVLAVSWARLARTADPQSARALQRLSRALRGR
ncbi:MAG: lipopolysaccharide biosynthesis protein [Burkholderiales bacterium]|nr:lipopolysaccharide biosynthesis protein [Burkholderiales bacterium]